VVGGDPLVTATSHAPPLDFDGIEDVLEALRERGHRISAPRRLVLEALFAAEGPVSAQFIADGLDGRQETLDRTSVYRNLEQLEELGVVRHVHLGHGPSLYRLVNSGDDEYLACERCGRVTSVDPTQLDPVRDQIRERFGYEARFGHFPVVGLCPRCAAGGSPTAGSRAGAEGEQQHSHGDYVHSHPHSHGREHSH
jgi:Fur family transcriptional regulator, ferric uptake regulator